MNLQGEQIMSHELLGLYQKIRETPTLAVDFPKETAEGRAVRLDSQPFHFSLHFSGVL